jgi:hypothetical protein
MEHYKCYKVYVTEIGSEHISDTLEFFPAKCNTPSLTQKDRIIVAAVNLTKILQSPPPPAPFHDVSNDTMAAVRKLAELFNKISATPPRVTIHTITPLRVPAAAEPPRVPIATTPPRVPLTTAPAELNQTREANVPIVSQEQTNMDPHTPRPTHFPHRYPTRTDARSLQQAYSIIINTTAPYYKTPSYSIRMAMSIIHPITGNALTYRQLKSDPQFKSIWNTSGAQELGRLAQGVGDRIKGRDTICVIEHAQVPKHKTVTYDRFVCDVCPQKAEPERTRLTVGGNLINYDGDVSTQTADLTTSKILWNSVISTLHAKYMCLDLKDFYLGTPMKEYEYMRLHILDIPEEIINQYNLRAIADNDWVCIEVRGGMYGLPYAGKLTQDLFQQRLASHGSTPIPNTPGLWKHGTRPVTFTLVIDDFGVKYIERENAEH